MPLRDTSGAFDWIVIFSKHSMLSFHEVFGQNTKLFLEALGKIGKEFTKISENNTQNSNRSTQQESVTNISSNNEATTSNIIDSQNDYPNPTFYL